MIVVNEATHQAGYRASEHRVSLRPRCAALVGEAAYGDRWYDVLSCP